jgi:exopolyphosphatase/guanosine-5'-triphosphate,3'-diphosphate pyrophosphatase
MQTIFPKRIAVIDLGTNTFNLLIADVFESTFEMIHSEKEGVALGMGGINQGIIAEDAFERGLIAIKRFSDTCTQFQVQTIKAYGTSALRDATNSPHFLSKIKKQTQIDIQIISGELEASLIYAGVKWSYAFNERATIMDIGGGSTEFIVATNQGIERKISLNIGVSRIFQELQLHDPLTSADIQAVENWLEDRSQHFFEDLQCDVLIGASGSFETFHEMIHKQTFPNGIAAQEINLHQLNQILDWILASNQQERDAHPFIIPIRRKMAPIAAIKTRWVIQKLNAKRIIVSPCSLKEGGLCD